MKWNEPIITKTWVDAGGTWQIETPFDTQSENPTYTVSVWDEFGNQWITCYDPEQGDSASFGTFNEAEAFIIRRCGGK